jgi:hypothetical protein
MRSPVFGSDVIVTPESLLPVPSESMWGRLIAVALVALASVASACSAGELGSFSGSADVGGCVERAARLAGDSTPMRLREVSREVARMRRLRFGAAPQARYLRRAELERRIRREIDSTYPNAEAAAESRALVALGALSRGTNLKRLLKRALPGQVAGFYDPRTRRLVVGSNAGRKLDGIERLTLAHELEHALVDQALGLPSFLDDQATADGREDVELAGLSLVEGDATLFTDAFASKHLSAADALRAVGPVLAASDEFDELPHYLQASTVFPYEEGLAFVCRLYDRGGWRAVDRAYRRLPQTSAQIMFPGRYAAGERATDPPDAQPPGAGWRLVERQAFGAANLLWLLQAPGGDPAREPPDARERAAAWAGGELFLWQRGGRTRLTLTLVERRGGRDLCASMREWFRAAEREGVVRCSGRVIRANLHS